MNTGELAVFSCARMAILFRKRLHRPPPVHGHYPASAAMGPRTPRKQILLHERLPESQNVGSHDFRCAAAY